MVRKKEELPKENLKELEERKAEFITQKPKKTYWTETMDNKLLSLIKEYGLKVAVKEVSSYFHLTEASVRSRYRRLTLIKVKQEELLESKRIEKKPSFFSRLLKIFSK